MLDRVLNAPLNMENLSVFKKFAAQETLENLCMDRNYLTEIL